MILDAINNKLLLISKDIVSNDIGVSCDVQIDTTEKIFKTYGKCHRQIYYEINNEFNALRVIDINSQLQKLFLSNKKKSIISLFNNCTTNTKFDFTLDDIGINIYSVANIDSCQKQHILETFFSLITSNDKHIKISKSVILYIDKVNYTREYVIDSVILDGDTFPTIDGVIDSSISLKNINIRRRRIDHFLKYNILPPVDYLAIYTPKIAKILNKCGLLSKIQYEKYLKDPFGDFNCVICDFKNKCKEDGYATV